MKCVLGTKDKEGKMRNYEFRHPSNIAIDSKDSIYYMDYEDSNLLKFKLENCYKKGNQANWCLSDTTIVHLKYST